jgi:hypothetical protein
MSNARKVVLCCGLALLVLGGCDGGSSPPAAPTTARNPGSIYGKTVKMAKDVRSDIQQTDEQAHQMAKDQTGEGKFAEIAGLKWPIPEGWTKQPSSSPMRVAEYSLSGGISVRFFAVGGGVDENMKRWRGQITNPISREQTKTFSTGNLKIHTITMNGTYAGMGPGGMASTPVEGTGFLGAIIEGGPSPVQVVMTGPWPAVEEAEKAWNMMLAGIQTK